MASYGIRDVEIHAALARSSLTDEYYHARKGSSYRVSVEDTNQSAGDTVSLFVKNPADSGVTGVLYALSGNPGGRSFVRTYDGFEEDTIEGTGTAVQVENVRMDTGDEGTTDAGALLAEQDPTFTPTDTHERSIVGGGRQAVAAENVAAPILLEPGRRVVAEVEKITGSDNVVVKGEWFEIARVYSEENAPYDDDEL